MMSIETPLYAAKDICLAPIDHEKDAEIEARWSEDPDYLRCFELTPARPLSVAQIKKRYEAIEKRMDEEKNNFHFTIRLRSPDASQDDRLLGFARITWVEWSHGNGSLALWIGSPEDRSKGYGSQALALLLRFAFDELNLHRISAALPEANTAGLRLFAKAGFVEEVRRRKAMRRDGREWDVIHLGLLQSEWLNWEIS